MPIKLPIVLTFLCLSCSHLSVQAAEQSVPAAAATFANETAIEFTANSGDTTDAFAGFIMVPENRSNPTSRKIRVNYVRFAATGKHQGPPIVYLAGGPGGSGIGTAKWRRFPLFMAMREFGDVIALDQRGTGESEQAQVCQSSEQVPLDKVVSMAQIRQHYQNAAKACLTRWQEQGADIYGYTTVQNAWDIDALRQHLGAEKTSLWGISYGSHLALAAMKLFPEHIDKVMLASAEGLNQTVKLPALTDDYFVRVQQVIDQQPLKQQVPDLTALIRRVHAKLDDQPVSLVVPDKNGNQTRILLQRHHMQALASMMIADPGQYLAMLIKVYQGLDSGNTDMLMGILQRGIFEDKPISFRLMPMAMDVASGITESRLQEVSQQAETSLLGEWLNFPMPQLNRLDPKLDLGDGFRQSPQSDIPTLLFTGTLDGRTYPQAQAEAVSGLTHLTHIKVVHGGHNLYMSSPEVLQAMQQFMGGQAVNKQDIVLPLPQLDL